MSVMRIDGCARIAAPSAPAAGHRRRTDHHRRGAQAMTEVERLAHERETLNKRVAQAEAKARGTATPARRTIGSSATQRRQAPAAEAGRNHTRQTKYLCRRGFRRLGKTLNPINPNPKNSPKSVSPLLSPFPRKRFSVC